MADPEATRQPAAHGDPVALPLPPLSPGVVLPGMVVPLAPETDEARPAAEAATADDGDGLLVLVPRVDGRYARVGTVARVESTGDLPNGVQALVLRGLHCAVIGTGVPGTRAGVWVEADEIRDPA